MCRGIYIVHGTDVFDEEKDVVEPDGKVEEQMYFQFYILYTIVHGTDVFDEDKDVVHHGKPTSCICCIIHLYSYDSMKRQRRRAQQHVPDESAQNAYKSFLSLYSQHCMIYPCVSCDCNKYTNK